MLLSLLRMKFASRRTSITQGRVKGFLPWYAYDFFNTSTPSKKNKVLINHKVNKHSIENAMTECC